MKRAYADIPEGQMHFRSEGDGEPVLLLHMAVGSSDEFTRVIPFLSKTYRAIAVDFLGQGDSDPAPSPYLTEDHTRTLVSFMDSLGIKKASVVGNHGGSMMAIELAVNWPERVDKLVLFGMGLWGKPSEDMAIEEPPDFLSRVEIEPDGSHLMRWWRRAALWGSNTPEILEERVIEYIKAGPRGEEMHWANLAYDAEPKLPLITCPTLVMAATEDPFYAVAPRVKSLVPNSKLATIESGPLYVDRVMPREYAEAILGFLNTPPQ